MDKTNLHSSLLFLMIKLEEAKSNQMSDKNFVGALTEVLRYFRDNGELKKAYELQKDSLADMANSPWAKLVIGMLTSKMQEDKVDAELPDIDALIKESSSDEFIEKKINDILGDNNVDGKEEQLMKIEIKRVTDWQRVVDAARFTQGKEPLGHEPSDEFKKQMILSEHSPLRELEVRY